MRVAPPPAGSFSDDSDGDAGAWPLAASTSRRRDASDDADDLRQMLDAAEAARAALREVASSAAAEREMAFEARDAANAERDLLRGELEPLRASLAEATRALAQRDDETRSLRFKLDQLLRHARERDRVTTATRPSSDRIEEEEEEEERVYIEALATLSASSELELAETRGALRDARDEVETFSSTNQSLRRERDALNEEVLVLKTKLERAEALRETLERTHASEMSASTRRAEAAEAEARLLVREKKEKAARDATRGDVPVDRSSRKELSEEDVVCVSSGDVDVVDVVSAAHHKSSRESPEEPEEPKEPPIDGHDDARNASNATARAYEELDAHRRSIQTHLEALQRDRETLASTKRTVRSESYL
jgi:chromosome segregation ATPase